MWTGVELREVRVFLTLADELHFGRTAERLGITHSRVSQTIRTLEVGVGGRLFDRTSRRVQLTELGGRLRERITPGYEQIERAFNDTREAAVGLMGALRIGMYTAVNGGPYMLEVVKTFEERHPVSAATRPSGCSPQPPTNNNDSRRSVVEINHSNNNNQQTNPVSPKPGQAQVTGRAAGRRVPTGESSALSAPRASAAE